MTPRLLILYSLILIQQIVSAQKKIQFYTKDGNLTSKDSSYYYTIGNLISGQYEDTLKFYQTASEKYLGRQLYKNGYLNGNFVFYHENGRLKSKGINNLGRPIGYVLNWYETGSPKQTVYFPENGGNVSEFLIEDYLIINYWDSLGNQLINNGNGYCNCYLEQVFGEMTAGEEETPSVKFNYSYRLYEGSLNKMGKVKDGLRDSIWTVKVKGISLYSEKYNMGVFKEGTRFLDNGKESTYSKIEESSEPNKGMIEFYNYVGKQMKYPPDARNKGIQGRVFVEFTIETDGSITNVRALKSPSESLSKEAIRVVKSSPKWIPGFQRGLPVRQKMVIPLIFKLG
jgi:TonB family protein